MNNVFFIVILVYLVNWRWDLVIVKTNEKRKIGSFIDSTLSILKYFIFKIKFAVRACSEEGTNSESNGRHFKWLFMMVSNAFKCSFNKMFVYLHISSCIALTFFLDLFCIILICHAVSIQWRLPDVSPLNHLQINEDIILLNILFKDPLWCKWCFYVFLTGSCSISLVMGNL